GVTGIIGCASSERLYQRSATSAFTNPPINNPVSDTSDVSSEARVPDPSENDVEPPVMPTPNSLAQSNEEPPTTLFKSIEAKSEHGLNEELNSHPAKSASRAGQETLRVGSDNRLLELLDQAFEEAIVEPAERRRLQFSKEVVDNPKVRHF